jgi:hypothetical protein
MKTDMAANPKLTKAWISYLKNNQIVAYKSDPDGKLRYKREVTSDDVIKFLRDNTHYTEEQIYNAVGMVGGKKQAGSGPAKLQNNPTPEKPKEPGKDLSTWMHYGMRPGEHPVKRMGDADVVDNTPRLRGPEDQGDPKKLTGKENPKLKYDPNSVSDVDFKEIPNEPKDPKRLPAPKQEQEPEKDSDKPGYKPRFRLRKIKEGLDDTTFNLDEKDVEQVFSLLSKENEVAPGSEPLDTGEKPEEKSDEQKQIEVEKIKLAIQNKMTDSQRKSLWRLLTDA